MYSTSVPLFQVRKAHWMTDLSSSPATWVENLLSHKHWSCTYMYIDNSTTPSSTESRLNDRPVVFSCHVGLKKSCPTSNSAAHTLVQFCSFKYRRQVQWQTCPCLLPHGLRTCCPTSIAAVLTCTLYSIVVLLQIGKVRLMTDLSSSPATWVENLLPYKHCSCTYMYIDNSATPSSTKSTLNVRPVVFSCHMGWEPAAPQVLQLHLLVLVQYCHSFKYGKHIEWQTCRLLLPHGLRTCCPTSTAAALTCTVLPLLQVRKAHRMTDLTCIVQYFHSFKYEKYVQWQTCRLLLPHGLRTCCPTSTPAAPSPAPSRPPSVHSKQGMT